MGLEDRGAKVFQAHNGDEALEMARGEKPDFVTLDIQMPGMGAVEVLSHFGDQGDLNGICVCVISGRPELRRFLVDKIPNDCLGFIDKPFTAERLVAYLEETFCS
ncbi:MAG: response regulator [bacterium]|nr:response regulator [bacterium]